MGMTAWPLDRSAKEGVATEAPSVEAGLYRKEAEADWPVGVKE